MSANDITVLCFAALREHMGGEQAVRLAEPPGARVRDLRATLAARYPALAPLLPSCRVAVNQEFVGDDAELPAGAEVALIPPVSGG